jgi:hypothetical protein
MLFSDVEGLTALLSRLGDRYGEALSAQRVIQRARFSEPGSESSAGMNGQPKETVSTLYSTPPRPRSAAVWQRNVTWLPTTGPTARDAELAAGRALTPQQAAALLQLAAQRT